MSWTGGRSIESEGGGETGRLALPEGRLVIAAVLVGVLGAMAAIVVRRVLDLGLHALYGVGDVTVGIGSLDGVVRVVVPMAGGLLGGGVAWWFARRGSQGVADVMEAIAIGRGRPMLRHTIGPALGSVLASLGGGSIGREGPIIQLGAAMGDLVAHPLPGLRKPIWSRLTSFSDRERRALIAAGTAAGFAAAYNTPLAAVLFVLEVMIGVVTLEVVVPVAIATAVGTVVVRAVVGDGPLYGVREFAPASESELVAYVVAGLLAALAGLLFMRLLHGGERLFQRLARLLSIGSKPLPRPFVAALGGFVVGVIALGVPAVAGNGYEPILWILDGDVPIAMLLLIAVTKALATTASVASGSPGGVFTPTMLVGAMVGAALGKGLALMGWVGVGAGGYALVGMASALAATTRAPLMATVLAFELSGDYALVLPLLLATGMAILIARRLSPRSIYEAELERRGIPSNTSLGERVARGVRARDVMEPVPAEVRAEVPLGDALECLAQGRGRLLYVVGDGPLAAISLTTAKDYWRGLMRGEPLPTGMTAGEVARVVTTVAPDDSLVDIGEKLFAVDWGELPVVSTSDPSTPMGVVTRRALLGAFDRELLQREALMTRVMGGQGASDYLELPDGHRAEVLAAPDGLIGEELDLADLRSRFGVLLIAVRRDRGLDGLPRWEDPEPGWRAERGDTLLVVGTHHELEQLARYRPRDRGSR